MKKVSVAKKWAKAKKGSGKSRNGTSANGRQVADYDERRTAEIESLLATEEWTRARILIRRELKKTPTSHWLITMLGLTYYEERDYKKAITYSKKALRLKPDCPLVLAHHAGTLAMLGRNKKALQVYQGLLDRDLDSLAYDECGEGMDWALQLVNDCHYRMGRCFQSLGNNEAARRSLKKYLHNRAHGVGSIYDRKNAEALLGKLA